MVYKLLKLPRYKFNTDPLYIESPNIKFKNLTLKSEYYILDFRF